MGISKKHYNLLKWAILLSRYFFLIIALATLFLQKASAQNSLDTIYNFCPDTIYSSFSNCYADTDRFFTAGVTKMAPNPNNHGFLASVDYSGNLLWSRKIFSSPANNAASGFHNIAKIDSALYAFVGTIVDPNAKPNNVILYPLLYVF